MADTGGSPSQSGGGGDSVGTLFVDVEARLDKFDQQMKEVEQNGPESAKRVERAMSEVTAATREADDAANGLGNTLLGLGTSAATGAVGLRRIVGFLGRVTGVAGAAASALAALAPALIASGVVLAVGGVSKAVDLTRRTIQATREVWSAAWEAMSQDAETAERGIRRISEALEDIPVVGGGLQNVFDAFTGDAERASRAVTDIAEGLRNIPVLGHLVQAGEEITQNFSGANAELRNTVQTMMRLNAESERRAQLVERTSEAIRRGNDLLREREQAAALAGTEGVERAEIEGRQAIAGTARQFDQILAGLRQDRVSLIQRLERGEQFSDILRSSELSESLNEDQIERLREASVNPQSAEQRRQMIGQIFGSARERIEEQKQAAIRAETEVAAARLANAREEARQREQQEKEIARAEAEARKDAVQQIDRASLAEELQDRMNQRRSLGFDIAAEQARGQGLDEVARAIETRGRFTDRIQQAEQAGRPGVADQLRTLRDLQLNRLAQNALRQDQASRGAFMEVGRARIEPAGGAGADEQRVHDPENERQTDILSQMLKEMKKDRRTDFATN